MEGGAVRLESPAEPLAWALDTTGTSGAFSCDWHSERTPGARAVACATRAVVDGVPLRVRVYGDDGAVSAARLESAPR